MDNEQFDKELRDILDCTSSVILLYEKGYIDRNEYKAIRQKIDKRYLGLTIESEEIK